MSIWTEMMAQQFELRHVDVKGVKTRSLRMGSGAPLIMLHGASGHIEAYMRTVAYHAEHFEVHLIDMLGHGYTDIPDAPLTIDRIAQHVLDYMDVHGMKKAHVCGISMGGWATGYLLVHHADRLLRSTLVAAAGSPAMGEPELAEFVRNSTKKAIVSNDREATRERLEVVIHRKDLITEELVDIRYNIYQQPDFKANVDNLLACTDSDLYKKYMLTPEQLAEVEQEVYLVWAEEDAWSKVTGAQHFVDHLPNRKLTVFSNAGHWPPYERAEDFGKFNVAFLKGGLAAVEEGTF